MRIRAIPFFSFQGNPNGLWHKCRASKDWGIQARPNEWFDFSPPLFMKLYPTQAINFPRMYRSSLRRILLQNWTTFPYWFNKIVPSAGPRCGVGENIKKGRIIFKKILEERSQSGQLIFINEVEWFNAIFQWFYGMKFNLNQYLLGERMEKLKNSLAGIPFALPHNKV